MNGLGQEIAAFRARKRSETADARQMAALQLACHIDLAEEVASADPEARGRTLLRLERTIERERQKGLRKHWSYDLNRHIALKQALDRLRGTPKPSRRGSGARAAKLLEIKRKRRQKAPLV